jgi:hypothetical protein
LAVATGGGTPDFSLHAEHETDGDLHYPHCIWPGEGSVTGRCLREDQPCRRPFVPRLSGASRLFAQFVQGGGGPLREANEESRNQFTCSCEH